MRGSAPALILSIALALAGPARAQGGAADGLRATRAPAESMTSRPGSSAASGLGFHS